MRKKQMLAILNNEVEFESKVQEVSLKAAANKEKARREQRSERKRYLKRYY